MDRIDGGDKLLRIDWYDNWGGGRNIRWNAIYLRNQESRAKGTLCKGDEIIEPGDILVFVSNSTDQFSQITRSVGKSDPELKEKAQVAVFGASQFGVRLSDPISRSGHSVVVIEPELDLANELVGSSVGNSKRLDVIHGDPQDEDLLRELDIHNHDIAVLCSGR